MVVSAVGAIWLSGHIQAFSANRGLLQFLVAIPAGSLAVSGALAFSGTLRPAQMLWAMVPVLGIILAGVGAFGPGYRAWPWAAAISAVVFIPWVAGLLIARSWLRVRRRPRQSA